MMPHQHRWCESSRGRGGKRPLARYKKPVANAVAEGLPIPTYDNNDITDLARVFTGISFDNNPNFQLWQRNFTQPMKMWDAQHDCGVIMTDSQTNDVRR